jgi:secondary thiamine-phosphate synthase enzyme
MKILTKTIHVKTKGEDDMTDITEDVTDGIASSKLKEGIVTIFVIGSTAAITTIEYESGLRKDFSRMLARLAPSDIEYEHQKMWHDNNGHSHMRASLIGPSLTVPFCDGGLVLGTWQQLVLVEMDTKGRNREIILQIMGQ